jgi:carbamoyl-phosphate synthase large subunit
MSKLVNVLITGCGGDIGQSIGKILNECNFVKNLSGCDISDKNAAKFIFKDFFLGLRCTNSNYLKNLEKIIEEKEIDLIIPIAEPELRFFSKENILNNIGNAKLVTASKNALKIGFDKLSTADFLKQHNLPFPVTNIINNIESIDKFPVILKSRTGSGSSDVNVVEDNETFNFLRKRNTDFIVQEYLPKHEGEFTCGVFRGKNGIIRTIILKRELTGGYSGYGMVVINKIITDLLISIAEKLDLIGSINIQLRLTSKGPVVFEINPRFSSTVMFRHMFGFKDLIWSLQDILGESIDDYVDAAPGREFYKGFNEYIS